MAEKIICLSITSYRGVSLNAIHYYGRMKPFDTESGEERWDVMRELTAEQAAELNEKDESGILGSYGHEAGDRTNRFDTREDVIERAKVQVHEDYGPDAKLYLGQPYNRVEDLEEV